MAEERRGMESDNLDERPTHLDLFSGIGGFAKAAREAGFRTIGFCEIDKYCQKVLAENFMAYAVRHTEQEQGHWSSTELLEREARMESGSESPPRIYSNIFDLNGADFKGISLITGGFPCQPFSVAGKRGGAEDDRAIWPQMFRVISEARPAWVLGENVPGIIPMELDNVLSDLEGIGYAARAFVIPACAVDARHRRDRVWIVARNSESNGSNSQRGFQDRANSITSGICGSVPDSNQSGLEGQRAIASGTRTQLDNTGYHCRWLPEPDVGRVAHGIRNRVDRLKGLGNAIVPQVAYEILREIRKLI